MFESDNGPGQDTFSLARKEGKELLKETDEKSVANGQTNSQKDKRIDGQTTNSQSDRQTDGHTHRQRQTVQYLSGLMQVIKECIINKTIYQVRWTD